MNSQDTNMKKGKKNQIKFLNQINRDNHKKQRYNGHSYNHLMNDGKFSNLTELTVKGSLNNHDFYEPELQNKREPNEPNNMFNIPRKEKYITMFDNEFEEGSPEMEHIGRQNIPSKHYLHQNTTDDKWNTPNDNLKICNENNVYDGSYQQNNNYLLNTENEARLKSNYNQENHYMNNCVVKNDSFNELNNNNSSNNCFKDDIDQEYQSINFKNEYDNQIYNDDMNIDGKTLTDFYENDHKLNLSSNYLNENQDHDLKKTYKNYNFMTEKFYNDPQRRGSKQSDHFNNNDDVQVTGYKNQNINNIYNDTGLIINEGIETQFSFNKNEDSNPQEQINYDENFNDLRHNKHLRSFNQDSSYSTVNSREYIDQHPDKFYNSNVYNVDNEYNCDQQNKNCRIYEDGIGFQPGNENNTPFYSNQLAKNNENSYFGKNNRGEGTAINKNNMSFNNKRIQHPDDYYSENHYPNTPMPPDCLYTPNDSYIDPKYTEGNFRMKVNPHYLNDYQFIMDKRFKRYENDEFYPNLSNEKISYDSSFEMHKNTNSDDYIYSCDLCMKKFKRLSTLKIHIFSHIRDAKIFKCPKTSCDSGFKSQSIATKHILHFHRDEKAGLIEILKRSKFSSVFRSFTALIDYFKLYKTPNPFIGAFCFGCFTYPRSMNDHPCTKMFYSLTQCPSCKGDVQHGDLERHVFSVDCTRPGISIKDVNL